MTPLSSVMVIHGGALGDFVLTLSVVRALRAAGARWIVMLARGSHAALSLRGGADEFLNIDIAPWHLLFVKQADITEELCRQLAPFDLVIDLLGAPALTDRAGVINVEPRPNSSHRGHITDQWFGDLAKAGVVLDDREGLPQITTTAAERQEAHDHLLRTIGVASDRIALMHPGSGSNSKCWPLERFIELARRLRTHQIAAVFSIGPVEMERLTSADRRRLVDAAPLLSGASIDELGRLLAASDLYIGNDSGVSHLAAAIGTPSIAIFGPTDPVRWSPLGQSLRTMTGHSGDCWPTVEEVLQTANSMLNPADQRTVSASEAL